MQNTRNTQNTQNSQRQDYVVTYEKAEVSIGGKYREADIMHIVALMPGWDDNFKPDVYVEDFKLHIVRSFDRHTYNGLVSVRDLWYSLVKNFEDEIVIDLPRNFINCTYECRFSRGIGHITITNVLNSPDVKNSIC